jgi:hypothetical protein
MGSPSAPLGRKYITNAIHDLSSTFNYNNYVSSENSSQTFLSTTNSFIGGPIVNFVDWWQSAAAMRREE